MTNTLISVAAFKRIIELEVVRLFPRWHAERQAKQTFAQLHGVDVRDVTCEWVSETNVQARDMTDAEKKQRDFDEDRWVAENDQGPCCACRCHDEDD